MSTHLRSQVRAVRLLFSAAFVILLTAHAPLQAQVPNLVHYQGRVFVGSTNFTGSGSFKFALVDTTGANTFWSNDGTSSSGSQPTNAVSLTVTNGLYSVLLGDTTLANMTVMPASVFSNADVRLRVWFSDGSHGFQQLTPDQRLAPSGYLPDGAVTSAKIGTGAIGTAQLTPGAVIPPVVVSGTTQTAAANTAYVATNAATTAFTLPSTANVGDTIQINAAGAGGWSMLGMWVQRTTGLPNNPTWASVASSSDGSHLVAVVALGGLYTSADYGSSWTLQTNGLPTNPNWTSVASSSDGSHLVAVTTQGGGGVFTSADYGSSWTLQTSSLPINTEWNSVASSSDGSHLVAVTDDLGLYTSTDFGSTWTHQTNGFPATPSLAAVASSSDGSHLVAVAFVGGALYTSADSGSTWTRQTSGLPPGVLWTSVASSSDGSHLVAVTLQGGLYTSINSGVSWTQQTSGLTGELSWSSVASSSDGSHLVAVAFNGGFYTSVNSGSSWTQQTNGLPTGVEWASVASSADGNYLAAVVSEGGLYTFLSEAQGTTTTLQYLGNGQWTAQGQTQVAAGAVGSAQIATGAVTSAQIAPGAVNTDEIAAGAVGGTQLASNLTLGGATSGTFSGNGSGLTNLNASNISSGTLADAQLSSNVPLLNAGSNVFSGSLGLGVVPTQAKLVVSGGANDTISPNYGYLSSTGANISTTASGSQPFSIWATARIATSEVDAFSDERIKNIVGPSDSAADLRTLMAVRVTDYTYKDTIAKGSTPQKKVIAQQVEKIFPQAVRRTTDVVPDIFQKATLQDGWVLLKTGLKTGERVRLIGDKVSGVYEVREIRDGGFRTDFQPPGDQVFVYGREVKDFRVVDYDALSMLNVSATQQLKKEKDREISKKDEEIGALKKRVEELEANEKKLTAWLTKLEQFIPAASSNHIATAATTKEN